MVGHGMLEGDMGQRHGHREDEGRTLNPATVSPRVSVIIPAYNAATTLCETLDSLLGQSRLEWEAIVVNDGSTDNTQVIAERYAEADSRIQLVVQSNGGEAAARNAGIKAARHEWLVFLDADDWIKPEYLDRMTAALAADPSLDAVHCRWARVAPDGTALTHAYQPPAGDLFEEFARYPAFVVHACVVRRTVVESIGCFDTTLKTSPDWDLWQRIARTGAQFGAIPDELAYYRMRPNSASLNAVQLLTDSLRVIEQGHRLDPRVMNPHPRHVNGRDREGLAFVKMDLVAWTGGLLLGKGQDPRPVLVQMHDTIEPNLDPRTLAEALFESILVARSQPPSAWRTVWPEVEHSLDEFLAALESHNKARGLVARVKKMLEERILDRCGLARPAIVGSTLGIDLELTEPLPTLQAPSGVSRLEGRFSFEGKPLGEIEVPVCDGTVPAAVLADAIAAESFWRILGAFFEPTVYRSLTVQSGPFGSVIRRGTLTLAEQLRLDGSDFWPQVHAAVGWTVFLQELWGLPDWPLARINNDGQHDEGGVLTPADGTPRWIEVARPLPELQIQDGRQEIQIVVTVGGSPLGVVPVPVYGGAVGPQTLRSAITRHGGVELCRMAVREALIGRRCGSQPGSLRARLQQRADSAASRSRTVTASGPPSFWTSVRGHVRGEVVIARRSHGPIGSSASRRAVLPRRVVKTLLAGAKTAGDASIPPTVWPRWVRRVRYDPGVLRLSEHPAGQAVEASRVERVEAPNRTPEAPPAMTAKLPILMYHRVAPTGAAALSRYRVTPDRFEAHLQLLSDQGFYSVGLDRWRDAVMMNTPLPGRAVLLTFDDGFLDFSDYAWPLLKRYGFGAMVFVVTDYIGRTNEWDRAFGEAVPLLDWDQMQRLRDEGVEFGSHAASHRHLTSLSNEEVVEEAAKSRELLERRLERPVLTMAYPHGAEDRVVRHLIGACGYLYGLSTREGRCGFDDPWLAMPRVEIAGTFGVAELQQRLGL